MKKFFLYILIPIILFVGGCRNFYAYKDGENEFVAYQSKLTEKSVNIISEVEAVKVTTGAQPDSIIPSVCIGWFWVAWLEVMPGDRLTFFKESRSMFSPTITGRTFLQIENNTDKKINITSTPKYFLNLGIFKAGLGENTFKVNGKEVNIDKDFPKEKE